MATSFFDYSSEYFVVFYGTNISCEAEVMAFF